MTLSVPAAPVKQSARKAGRCDPAGHFLPSLPSLKLQVVLVGPLLVFGLQAAPAAAVKEPARKAAEAVKPGKRRGPLPLWLVELVVIAAVPGLLYALLRWEAQVRPSKGLEVVLIIRQRPWAHCGGARAAGRAAALGGAGASLLGYETLHLNPSQEFQGL